MDWQKPSTIEDVIATARDPDKIVELKTFGFMTLMLDVLSDESIKKCVSDYRRQP
jgi:hypothetical protein